MPQLGVKQTGPRRSIRHFLSITEGKTLPAGAFFLVVVDKKGKLRLTLKAQVPFCRLGRVRRTAVF